MKPYSARRVGELLPAVARELRQKRPLAVDDLVVREREHEVLVAGVHEREGQLVVVEAAVHRLVLGVGERVVHPAHVPLEREAEAAHRRRPRDAGPRRRLLGDDCDAGLARMEHLVQLPQERDGLEVLAAALLVRQPLARVARVVQVEHRGHGVHAQPVGVELAHPVEGVREQEVADLVAPEVEDESAPVGMGAAARILVLVEARAVEACERPLVAGKWAGTQSRITPMPAPWNASTSARKSSGVPRVDCGAKYPLTWYPHDGGYGCSMTGISSTCVKPRSAT